MSCLGSIPNYTEIWRRPITCTRSCKFCGSLLPLFFDVIFAIQAGVALGYKIADARVIVWCILLLLAIPGNYLPNLRPNYFVGTRTPWTLENVETWRATHRLGGKLMFFGSL